MHLAKSIHYSILLIFLSISCYSQDPQYEIYGVKDGLPSPEIYHAVVDHDGQIVLTTDRGISIYNGYEFNSFSYKDGLLDNSNFRIIKHKDELWFLGFNGKITQLKDGIFSAHPINQYADTLQNFSWWEDIVFINEQDYYLIENTSLGAEARCFKATNNNGDLSFKKAVPEFKLFKNYDKDRYKLLGCEVNNRYLLKNVSLQDRRGRIRSSAFERYFEPGEKVFDGEYVFFSKTNFDRTQYDPLYSFTWKESQLHIIRDNDVELLEQYSTEIAAIFPDKDGSLWVCSGKGLYHYLKRDGQIRKERYFENWTISSIVQDLEGSYWITTLTEGVIKVPSFAIRIINKTKERKTISRVNSFLVHNDELLIGCNNGQILRQKNINALPEYVASSSAKNLLELFYFEGVRNSEWQVIDFSGKSPVLSPHLCSNGYKFFHIFNKDIIISSATRKIFANTLEKEGCREFSNILLPHSVTALDMDDEGNLFIGTLKGIYEANFLKDTVPKAPYFSAYFNDKRISEIIIIGDRRYIVATMGYGLTFINNDTYTTITDRNHLSSDLINTLFLQNDSTLWIGTNMGLDKIQFATVADSVLINSIDHFSVQDGLGSNYIIEMIEWKNELFIASTNGYSHFDITLKPQRDFRAPVQIDSLFVNQKWRLMDYEKELDYNENDITINYSAVQFNKPESKEFYSYRLLTKNEDSVPWISTNNRNVTFPNLEPVKYTFEILTNGFGSRKGPVKSVSFTIIPHFTQTLWFKFLIGILIALTLYLLMRAREKRIKQLNEITRMQSEFLLKVNNAQLTALRSQMNPHFIFNALNSIQNFVFKKDVRQANHFLTKFSRLIRKSLELSKLDKVLVADELEFLNNYLELEEMRFPGLFEYHFHIAPELNTNEIEIPPLLIQPLLENSIRHGFKGIEYLGKLDIYMNLKNGGLDIIIVDNGVGLKESKKSTSIKKHKSFAMKILKDRVQMINQVSGNEDSFFHINEIVDGRQKVKGVKANLFIAAIRNE